MEGWVEVGDHGMRSTRMRYFRVGGRELVGGLAWIGRVGMMQGQQSELRGSGRVNQERVE